MSGTPQQPGIVPACRLRWRTLLALAVIVSAVGTDASADQTLICAFSDTAPRIDGRLDDPVWATTTEIVTRDSVADIEHRLRCAWDGKRVYLLASYPDADENRQHKTLHWQADEQRYVIGPEREDTLVLKWNLEPFPVDLSVSSDDNYHADIWFWKAVRTDPGGYADDKLQIYSTEHLDDATLLLSKQFRQFYLVRKGDPGRSAYQQIIPLAYLGDAVAPYQQREPQGSRGDIQARGHWQDGVWTVEFARDLITQDPDDIAFIQGQDMQFGISRYEIAGRQPDPTLQIPLYGSGDIGETLYLRLAPQSSP